MRFRNTLLGLVIASTSTMSLACDYPSLVPVPIDQKLSEQELAALDAKLEAYVSAMEAFLMCNREEGLSAGEQVSRVYVESIVVRHDQAVREVEVVASLVADLARYNGLTRRLSIDSSIARENRIFGTPNSQLGLTQLRYHRSP